MLASVTPEKSCSPLRTFLYWVPLPHIIIVFPAEAEYSHFSADFRQKIFFWIFLDYSVWHFCFRMYLVVKVMLDAHNFLQQFYEHRTCGYCSFCFVLFCFVFSEIQVLSGFFCYWSDYLYPTLVSYNSAGCELDRFCNCLLPSYMYSTHSNYNVHTRF